MRILQNFWKIRKLHSEHTYTVQNKQRKSTSRHIIIIIKNIKCREKNLKVSKEKHSLQFSCSVMSDSLQPHGLQHARYPCPSPTPGVGIYPNSCPLSHVHWVHDAMQPSHPLSSPSIPAFNLFQHQGLFLWVSSSSQLQLKSLSFSWNVSASASVLPMNIQDWFPLGWTGWISLQSKGLSRVLSNTTVQNHQFFWNSDRLYFGGAPKSLQMVTAAMKLKVTCTL